MRSEARFACALALGGWVGAGSLAAAPAKPEVARKSFDYRRPDPGEMLPNPVSGIGTPPQLQEFAPTGTMGEAVGAAAAGEPSATEAPSAPPPSAPEPAAPNPTTDKPAASAAAPAASPPPPPPAPPPAPAPPRPAGLQATLAAEIGRVGIEGVTATPPGTVPAEPTAERAWTVLAGGLERSRTVWGRRFPSRTPGAEARVEAVAEPGRLTIVTAPGRLTGAFDEPPP